MYFYPDNHLFFPIYYNIRMEWVLCVALFVQHTFIHMLCIEGVRERGGGGMNILFYSSFYFPLPYYKYMWYFVYPLWLVYIYHICLELNIKPSFILHICMGLETSDMVHFISFFLLFSFILYTYPPPPPLPPPSYIYTIWVVYDFYLHNTKKITITLCRTGEWDTHIKCM